jgi:hypothetical protein
MKYTIIYITLLILTMTGLFFIPEENVFGIGILSIFGINITFGTLALKEDSQSD